MLINVKMTLHEISRHVELCIFCLTKNSGYSNKSRGEIQYAMKPTQNGDELPMPKTHTRALLHKHQNN